MKKLIISIIYVLTHAALASAETLADLEAKHLRQGKEVYSELEFQSNRLLDEYRAALNSGKPMDPSVYYTKLKVLKQQVEQKQKTLSERIQKEREEKMKTAAQERVAELMKRTPGSGTGLRPIVRAAQAKPEDAPKEETTVLYDPSQFPSELEFPQSPAAAPPAPARAPASAVKPVTPASALPAPAPKR
jgi:hypothetical protein